MKVTMIKTSLQCPSLVLGQLLFKFGWKFSRNTEATAGRQIFFFATSVILNRILVNDDKDDDEDKTKKKICSIAPLNVVDIHEMIMDKTNNEEELRKIKLKLELKN